MVQEVFEDLGFSVLIGNIIQILVKHQMHGSVDNAIGLFHVFIGIDLLIIEALEFEQVI